MSDDQTPAPTATRVAPRVETRPADEGPTRPKLAKGTDPVAPVIRGARRYLRCVVKTAPRIGDAPAGPLAPFHTKSFGGKCFAVQTFKRVRGEDGESREIPVRGQIEEFVVSGDAFDDLERVRQSIARCVVRWTSKAKHRGVVLETAHLSRDFDRKGNALRTWTLRPDPNYVALPDDEPLSKFVQIEEVVPGSDHGPIVSLEPKHNPLKEESPS